jgi:hypothetical protein
MVHRKYAEAIDNSYGIQRKVEFILSDMLYSIHPKLLDTCNKSFCHKLDDLFLSYPNLYIF